MNSKAETAFQLIDNELGWRRDLTKLLEKSKVNVNTKNYKVVSIIGAQSSGKSTLLNYLFETKFQVMSSEKSRAQTTRGIFVQPAIDNAVSDTLLVFDVEGTDSSERQDYGSKFEKMLCTFALVVSDVLIVNMLTTDVGRNKGSSMQLLKTILQINVKLFKHEIKPKKVLIVLRDFGDEENIKEIDRKFKKFLQDSLNEIETAMEVSLQEIIQYELITMPHFKYEKENFNRKVKEIQKKLKEGDVFSQNNPSVPLNGLEKYLESIWKKIKSDETLDIPNEQFLVSNYLCDKAFDESFAAIDKELSRMKMDCTKKLLAGEFLKSYDALKKIALEKFKQLTIYIDKNISQPIERELIEVIDLQFKDLSSSQIELLSQSIEKKLENDVKTNQRFQTIDQLLDSFERLKKSLVDYFQKEIRFYKLKGEPASEREKTQISSRISDLQAPLIDKYIRELDSKRKNDEKIKEDQRFKVEKQKEERRKKEEQERDKEYRRKLEQKDQELRKKNEMLEEAMSSRLNTTNSIGFNPGYSEMYNRYEYPPCGTATRTGNFFESDFYPFSRVSNEDSIDSGFKSFLLGNSYQKPNKIYKPSADYSPPPKINMSYPKATGPFKKDGTPDMRYKVNKETLKSNGHQYNLDHSLDMRYSNNQGPKKKDGTLDMRHKVNWS